MKLILTHARVRKRAAAWSLGAALLLGLAMAPSAWATQLAEPGLVQLDDAAEDTLVADVLPEAGLDLEVVEDPGLVADDEELADFGALKDADEADAYINEDLLDIDSDISDEAFNELISEQESTKSNETAQKPAATKSSATRSTSKDSSDFEETTRSNASRSVDNVNTGEETPILVAALLALIAGAGSINFVRSRRFHR